jgi:LruC domain-containing protein
MYHNNFLHAKDIVYSTALLTCLSCLSSTALATSFSDCPEEAFVVQTPSGTPKAFGVDMATGSYTELSSNLGSGATFNAVGYNDFDDYIYGWDKGNSKLKRFGSDYTIAGIGAISKTNAANNAGDFIAGDVSPLENAWYGYKKNHGLYTINLDNSPYAMTKVSGSGSPTWNLADMAFHPSDGYIYAVDNGSNGNLLRIDPSDGSITDLGVAIEAEGENSFGFGAQFFDADGNMYISNNGDGKIYKIDISAVSSSLFAFGPSSSSNDGARCANAPISVGSNVDFGDAPDTYGTTLANNGPRHNITALNFLGTNADNESDAYPHPLSDDATDASDDEDGIAFTTGFELGESAIVVAELGGTASTAYLNAWIDWNSNGSFESSELVIDDTVISTGNNNITVNVPLDAAIGDTWARFRVSDTQDIPATGGLGNGEVEDYQITVTETGITAVYYPSASTYTSLVFEDLYPTLGDFDMNDVIMHVRYTEYIKQATPTWTDSGSPSYALNDIVQYGGNNYQCITAHTAWYGAGWTPASASALWEQVSGTPVAEDLIRRVKFESQLAAMGAFFHNGFAIKLPGIANANVSASSIQWSIDGVAQSANPLEEAQTDVVIIFADDLWDHVTLGESECSFLRTETGCGTAARTEWSITVPFNTEIAESTMPEPPYAPFIFAANNHAHGSKLPVAIVDNPHRNWEVHLKNNLASDTFSNDILGTFDDSSSGSNTFQNENGLPWALEIPTSWKHPLEGNSLTDAYSQFSDFAADSSGTTNPTWYLEANADSTKIFND